MCSERANVRQHQQYHQLEQKKKKQEQQEQESCETASQELETTNDNNEFPFKLKCIH